MIENESQQGAVAVIEPPDRPTDAPAPGPIPGVEVDPPAPRELSTKDVIATLQQLGPVVSTMAIASLILPGVMGAFVLVSVVASLGELALVQDLAMALDPRTTLTLLTVGAVAYALVMAVATGSILLPTYATATVAGSLFGLATGSVVAMVGVTGGALIGYLWGTALARGRVMDVIGRHERASVIHRAIVSRSGLQEGGVVALIRIPPNSPFALTNLLLSSTSVGVVPYTIGTALGIMPRTLIAVWVGSTLKDAATQDGGTLWTVGKIALGLAIFYVVYRILSKWAREALREVEASARA